MKKLNLPKPKSHTEEILKRLIEKGEASIEQFYYLCGFRTRISELVLKHGLYLQRIPKEIRSQYGNVSRYYIHILPENQKEKAIEIYINLNNQKK